MFAGKFGLFGRCQVRGADAVKGDEKFEFVFDVLQAFVRGSFNFLLGRDKFAFAAFVFAFVVVSFKFTVAGLEKSVKFMGK